MKWPNTLTVVRHGESEYNILKALKENDPTYKEFKSAYNKRKKDPETAKALAQTLLASGKFILGVGDFETPLTERGKEQSRITGSVLKGKMPVPDVVLVSPYVRTAQTLENMTTSWPELGDVKTVKDDRVREQEHGLAILYNDWRIFQVMHPEQDRLRELEGPYWYRYPQGQNVPDVRANWYSMLGTITRDYHEKSVLIVTHHLSILALRANLERLGVDEYQRLDEHEKPVNCGVTIYEGDPTRGDDGRLDLKIYNQQLY